MTIIIFLESVLRNTSDHGYYVVKKRHLQDTNFTGKSVSL
jgi:hypothetical protein